MIHYTRFAHGHHLQTGNEAVQVKLLVFSDALLEEVGLALQGDHLHPIEGVGRVEDLAVSQGRQQAICDELDVLGHQVLIHSDQIAGESPADELPLHLDCATDHLVNDVFWELMLQHAVEQARKVRVEALIAGDELVGEGQARHQAALLQPEEGAEAAAEEDALHSGKSHQALSEAALTIHPLHGPQSLLLHSRHGVDGVEKAILLYRVLDVLLNQQRVCLGMDVLHGYLEAIEGPSLWDLHLCREVRCEVLEHDAVGCRKEGQDVLHEVLLTFC